MPGKLEKQRLNHTGDNGDNGADVSDESQDIMELDNGSQGIEVNGSSEDHQVRDTKDKHEDSNKNGINSNDGDHDDNGNNVSGGNNSNSANNNGNSNNDHSSITNDAVEAAVMRYVGGTDFNQWTAGFLDDELTNSTNTATSVAAAAANVIANASTSPLKAKNDKSAKRLGTDKTDSKGKKKRKLVNGNNAALIAAAVAAATAATNNNNNNGGNATGKNNALVDPELAQLDSSSNEHDRLVQAAINDAKELAQFGNFDQEYLLSQQKGGSGNNNHASEDNNSHNNDGGNNDDSFIGPKHEGNIKAINQAHVDAAAAHAAHLHQQQHEQQAAQASVASQNAYHQLTHQNLNPHPELGNIASMHNNEVATLVAQAATNAGAYVTGKPQGKMFSKEEHEAIDKFIVAYCEIHKLSREDICKRIWSNSRVKDNFWESLQKVLPERSRASVYKHVRRAYHVFSVRGKWNAEEDARLGALAKDKEGQWKAIGEIMGRMPEDCRDRWRNYVKCGENRAQNKWTEEEEEKLKSIIHEIFQENPLNPVINWTVVSEKMGGLRSRIQCRYKWNKLLKRQATYRASNMSQEDRLWLVTRLKELQFEDESQVEWDALASLHPRGYWTGSDFKVCFEKMRSSIKDFKNKKMDEICNILFTNIYGNARMAANENVQVDNSNNNANNIFNVSQINQIANEHQHHHQILSAAAAVEQNQQIKPNLKSELGGGHANNNDDASGNLDSDSKNPKNVIKDEHHHHHHQQLPVDDVSIASAAVAAVNNNPYGDW